MSQRLTADRREALDRLGERAVSFEEPADRAAYLFWCMAVLGNHAPEVLHFILDRADERLPRPSEGGQP